MVVNLSRQKIKPNKPFFAWTKKVLFLVPIILSLVFIPEFSIFAAAPTVVTSPAENITKTNATLIGYVSNDGGETITATGFEFGLTVSYGQTISGNEEYLYVTSIVSSGGIEEDQVSSPRSIALDSSNNVYVSELNNNRIQKFNSDGVFSSMFGWGVDTGANSFETCTSGCQAGIAGSGNGQFQNPRGINFDSSGNIYVSDFLNDRIQKFDSSGNYISQFNTVGTFRVEDIDFDSSGNIYATEIANDRLYKFDSSGSLITFFGSLGSGINQFNNPGGIYIDDSDNIYVADTGNDRIQILDTSGNFVSRWGVSGLGEGELSSPLGIAMNSEGELMISNFSNSVVQKFTTSGTFISDINTTGSGALSSPTSLDFDSNDNLYVVNSGSENIKKYRKSFTADLSAVVPSLTCGTTYYYRAYATNASGTSYGSGQSFTTLDCDLPLVRTRDSSSVTTTSVVLEGSHEDQGSLSITSRGFNYGTSVSYGSTASQSGDLFIDEFGSSGGGGGNGTFLILNTAGTDADGNIYTTDQFEDVVQKFDSAGNFISQYNVSAPAVGGVTTPASAKGAPDGKLYIVDYINSKIIRFDDNNFTNPTTFAAGAGLSSPTDVAFDSSGNVYVADYGNNRVIKLNSAGTMTLEIGSGAGSADGEFSNPVSVALDSLGNVYVVDAGNSRIQKFDATGAFLDKVGASGTGDSEFSFSTFSFIAVDADNYVYVADTSNNRIQKFDSNLNYLSQFGTSGTGDGEFSGPSSIAIGSDGDLIVSDSGNNRIQIFNEYFTASISGLTCGTTYHYRAFSTNADGTDTGDDSTFTTSACPPGSSGGGGSTGTKLPYVEITNKQKETKTKDVSLDVYAPNLVESFSLSNTLDFSNKIDYKNNGGITKINWDLCLGLPSCVPGQKFVYAKFYYKDGSENKESQTSILYIQDKTCPYFNGYAKKDDKNNKKDEVIKIQEFLNEELNAGLIIDGIFGVKTDIAVKAFQQKYFKEIIVPWQNLNGLDKPTGWWYKTTSAWANTLLGCDTKAKL